MIVEGRAWKIFGENAQSKWNETNDTTWGPGAVKVCEDERRTERPKKVGLDHDPSLRSRGCTGDTRHLEFPERRRSWLAPRWAVRRQLQYMKVGSVHKVIWVRASRHLEIALGKRDNRRNGK